MKCTTIIDPQHEEEILIYLKKQHPISKKIEDVIARQSCELIGYGDSSIVKLDVDDVYCFTIEDNKVYALTPNDRLMLKQRLYIIEEMCGDGFVKINQSCIVNLTHISKFDITLGGSLMVVMKNGYRDYVSRRQMKIVKERIGFNL